MNDKRQKIKDEIKMKIKNVRPKTINIRPAK